MDNICKGHIQIDIWHKQKNIDRNNLRLVCLYSIIGCMNQSIRSTVEKKDKSNWIDSIRIDNENFLLESDRGTLHVVNSDGHIFVVCCTYICSNVE